MEIDCETRPCPCIEGGAGAAPAAPVTAAPKVLRATARMRKLAFSNGRGRVVTVRTDPTQDAEDRYGRLLAYVSAAGVDFGRAMVASGWATTYVYNHVAFQRVARYRSAQGSARSARRGVYAACGGDFHRD